MKFKMDFKEALVLLLLNVTAIQCTASVGFLLYVPGNLESGTSNQAYIELNTTDTVSLVLDFIHGGEGDRHFSSSAVITGGAGFIGIEVPEVDYWYGRVNLTGEVESTKEVFHASKDNIYIYRDAQKVTFIESDKPIYKPGQEVHFRLVTIDSQFKPDTSNVSKIQVESPQGIRLAQWKDVERPQGLVDLSFQLISEPPLGEYAIRAYIDGDWVVQPFKVDEYVLPKLEVTINAASYLMINAKEYRFQVCAKYTYGQPVRGTVSGQAGKVERSYHYGYYPRPAFRLGEVGEEVDDMTDAVTFSGELDNEGCLDVTVNVTGMSLRSYDNPYWRTKLGVEATIIEESTGNEFTERESLTTLETVSINLELQSPAVFKPSLPYQGRIKLNYKDQKPAANELVEIEAEIAGTVVHSEEYTSDDEGIVIFEIPFATKNQSISLKAHVPSTDDDVEDDDTPRNVSQYELYPTSGYYSLDPAYSPTGRYIQIQPIYGTVNAGDAVQVRVLYTSNDSDVSSNFKFQFVARNRLMDAGATQVGESRKRRQAGETECERQVNEASGKGDDGAFSPDCDDEGLFIPNQCHPTTHHCWCADPETGSEVEGTRRGPDEPAPECPDVAPIELPFGEIPLPDSFNQCQEGFEFADGVKKCVRIETETECQRQAKEAGEKVVLGSFKPNCTDEGRFTAKQCHISTGHCWCVEEETGVEVPETRSGPTEGRIECTVTPVVNETECQRQVREADERGPLPGSLKPECDTEGKFLAKQCRASSGHCWCVEVEIGAEIDGTRTGPTETRVDCSETECQRKVRIADGGILLGAPRPSCEDDGTYSSQQCHGSTGNCWCAEPETGTEIEDTRTSPGEDKIDCHEILTITVRPLIVFFPTPEPVVHVDPQDLHEVSFTVKITPNLSPEARLLVYYTSPEGEVVADSITIKVNEVFENEVTLDFESDEVKPGGETKMTISAEPGSLCSVGIVDKSVYVLAGDNKMTPKKLFSAFDLSVRTVWSSRSCGRYGRYGRKKRDIIFPYYRSDVHYQDSQDVFSDSGLMTLTNFDIEVAPCFDYPEIAYSRADDDGPSLRGGAQESDPVAKAGKEKIRSYFPSTWLWALQQVSDSPAELDLEVPHSITDWIANGFCTNVETGVGIAPAVTLRAFQPFFLSMSLPYSIIREEKTPILVTVFNYLDQCLLVRVTLTDSEAFILSGEDVFTVAVPAGESTTVTFKIAASAIGEIPIQVSAVSIDDEDALCGNEAVSGPAGTSDTVVRTLKVKPEGEEETISKSEYVCLEEGDEAYTRMITIDVPEQHVPDTAEGEITITGDLVGNTLSNVEELIRMPYGCGEQNLLSMVPNIVALQYLESVGESTPEIAAEAKKFISAGYQRELNYRRDDNSYSAFGNSSPAGSTFLTAFVVRTYAHAKMFVNIDEDDLSVTIEWLRSIQEKDGSFRTVGYLAHKAMKGGVNNNVTLAAYVVSTFLEAGYTLEDRTVSLAFDYVNSQLDSLKDNYAAAILAYAYALAQMDQFEQVYEKLEESVIEAEDTIHWESNREDLPSYTNYYQDSSKAQNVEMTAYVLRAILLVKGFPNVELVGSTIARWLAAQRNPRGGFSSTQDTVIGLTALAEFSKLGSGADSELSVTIDVEDGETLVFDVTSENRFLLQRGSYEEFPAEITVTAEGVGCVLYSVSADYYIKKAKQTLDPFTLGVKASGQTTPKRRRRDAESSEEEDDDEETCDRFTINIAARYNGEDGASNMAIINFRPVSGYIFDKESLDTLKERYDFLRRYEVNGDTITFYFDEVNADDMVFEVDVIKEFEVEDAKPAFITILDYYENDLKVAEEFEFLCGGAAAVVDPLESSTPSTTYTTPFSPTGFKSSTPTAEPDFDECEVPGVCGGPEWTCRNYPGTYECLCAEGFQLDAEETNCVGIPSCPVCAELLPEGVEELICSSDLIETMKVRVDGSVRPLINVITDEHIEDRYYYDVDIDDACTCNKLDVGSRIIIVAHSDKVHESSGRWDEAILLDDTTIVLPSVGPMKKYIQNILENC